MLVDDFIFPHLTIYQDEILGNDSLIIDYGTGGYYLLNEIASYHASKILLLLLSTYYVFDTHFPSCYGILNLVDDYCLAKNSSLHPNPLDGEDENSSLLAKMKKNSRKRNGKTKKNKTGERGESVCLVQFASKFAQFLASPFQT